MAEVMVVSIGLFDGHAPHATSNGRIRPEGRLKPRSPSRNGYGLLFSPAAKWRHSSRETKKPSSAVLRLRFGPCGCGPIAPRAKDRHRGCDGRSPTTEEDHHGYHRNLHRGGQWLHWIGQDADA